MNTPRSKWKKVVSVTIVVLLLVIVGGIIVLRQLFSSGGYLPSPMFNETCPTELIFKDGETIGSFYGIQFPLKPDEMEWVRQNCRLDSDEKPLPRIQDRVVRADLPMLQGLGISLPISAPSGNTVGDFDLSTAENSTPSKVIHEFGSSNNYHNLMFDGLRKGTPVVAVLGGNVVSVGASYSEKLAQVIIRYNGNWEVVYDYLVNVSLQEGDEVSIGQIVGEVAYDEEDSAGYTSLAIRELQADSKTRYHCPVVLLDPKIVDEITKNLKDLMSRWEDLKGNAGIYAETESVRPGCEVFWTR